jgi:hypothetical protein
MDLDHHALTTGAFIYGGSWMNRFKRFWTLACCSAVVGLAVVFSVGCGPSTMWHLWKGEQNKDPDHPLTPPSGKKEIIVAVSVTATPGVPPGVDLDLASKIGSQMKVISEANNTYPIKLVESSKVNAIRTNDPEGWARGNPAQFAKKVGADFWIDVTLHNFSLVDRESAGEICRGRATLDVSVYEAGVSAPKFQYPLSNEAPLRPNDVTQMSIYRNEYIGKLATQIAFKHVKYKKPQEDAAMK